jgi:hypothetical protein
VTAPSGDPAYKVNTWKVGYQSRQVGVSGLSVYNAMSNPPAALTTADGKPSVPTGLTPPQAEPNPTYN